MKKKILINIILLIVMLGMMFILTGCGEKEDEDTSSSKSKSTEQEVYEKANNEIATAAKEMGNIEKDMYNSTVKKYVGDSAKGSTVKIMIEDIIMQNLQNVDENGKFISIHQEGIEDFDDDELEKTCKEANIYENSKAENNQENVDSATKEMRKLRAKISSGENYEVRETMKDGIIYAVTIKPSSK